MKKILLFALLFGFQRAQAQIINTIAGTGDSVGYAGDGGPATLARLNYPRSVAVDLSGNIYIADYYNNVIRKVNAAGVISTYAGTGVAGYSGDGGQATAARFNGPIGIDVDGLGNLYVADITNAVVRKISASGIISTFAGGGTSGLGDGGPATAGAMAGPCGIATDGSGNVFIADGGNQRIRKVNASGIISTIAGNGAMGYTGDGGPASAAEVNYPNDLAVDASGNVYIADAANNRIRKINTSGIITTIAGNGVAGYAGDGGMASAAEINDPNGIAIDGVGNIFIAESGSNVVREISPYGVISTLAGNGTTGFSGDGYLASLAELAQPWSVAVDGNANVYVADIDNMVIRKIKTTPNEVADSFDVYISNYCNGPFITVAPNHFSAGMSVKTWYGDGTSDSMGVTALSGAVFSHNYANSGAYTIKNILYESAVAVDSIHYSYNYYLCNTIPVRFYMDFNADCVKDAGDTYLELPVRTEVDSNGVAVDTISSTGGFDYIAYGNVGDLYTFHIISAPVGIYYSCPSSGMVNDTLNSLSYSSSTVWFAMQCNADSAFDLSAHMQTISGRHTATGNILIGNAYCNPTNALVSMTFSPSYVFEYSSPVPDSIVGNVAHWHLNGVSASDGTPRQIMFNLTVPGGMSTWLTPGDTVQYYCSVTPIVGDTDTVNNHCVIVDTVRSSWDPNEMMVSPSGCIDTGAHNLEYTIYFENTGNDTAFNISVLDTLSPNVNVSSMQVVTASAAMFVTKMVDAAGQNILKFDFPGINLLDSSHHGLCEGAVIFDISTRSGLPSGAEVLNRAGIYFDYNSVVMTNTVGNQMGGCIPTSVIVNKPADNVAIYPNPASTQISVAVASGIYQTITVSNAMGQQWLQQPVTGSRTDIMISGLPSGVYYIMLSGDHGSRVEKFVKM